MRSFSSISEEVVYNNNVASKGQELLFWKYQKTSETLMCNNAATKMLYCTASNNGEISATRVEINKLEIPLSF